MHRITLIHHQSGEKTCIYYPEAISGEGIAYVSYPIITDQVLEELKNENTTKRRVNEILSSLTNLCQK